MSKANDDQLEKLTYIGRSVVIPDIRRSFMIARWLLGETRPHNEKGLFAKMELQPGTYIGEYEGYEINNANIGQYEDTKYILFKTNTPLDANGRKTIQGRLGDSWLKYANHQPEEKANAIVDENYRFFSNRLIKPNEEITWCYGQHINFQR